MADTALATVLGKQIRCYVGNTATPANDAAYARLTNENKIGLSVSAKTTEVETKENGGQIAVLPGPIQYEIKLELAEVYADPSYAIVKAALNKVWPFQLRIEPETGPVKKELSGMFVVASFEENSEAAGARTASVTLRGAGAVTMHTPAAALTPA